MSFQNCKIRKVNANADLYHEGSGAARGEEDYNMTSSALREFFHCPARWIHGYQPPETEAKEYGLLLDTLYLTPEQFDAKYAVPPETYKNEKGEEKPWNNNANVCKAWNEDAIKDGRKPLRKSDLQEARSAVAALNADEIIKSFWAASDKQVWIQGEWLDDKTGLIIPVQALIDLVPRKDTEFFQALGDLKTTRSASRFVFPRYSSQRGYHQQGAFYMDMFNAATGEKRDSFCFVLSENFPPYQTGRMLLEQRKLELGRVLYQAALGLYAQCRTTGKWPGYNDHKDALQGWSLDMATKWDEAEALQAIEGGEQGDETPAPEPESEELLIP